MKNNQEKDNWFEKLKKTYKKISDSNFFVNNEKIRCPVCGEFDFINYHEICDVCGWQHDWMQLANPRATNYANNLSLNTYKKWFKFKRELDPEYLWIKSFKEEGQPNLKDYYYVRKQALKMVKEHEKK
jgi:ribosomal protein L37E